MLSTEEAKKGNKPSWLKVKLPSHQNFFYVSQLLKRHGLHTICQSAKCPNISRCWAQKTATFLILGETCTRRCSFCAVKKGIPSPPSPEEPRQVGEAVNALSLNYAVITSVTRDDLADGGASHFVETIRAIKKINPEVKVEVLIPDFKGDEKALASVALAKPDVVNHNLETVEALYPQIGRPKANYQRSLEVLEKAKEKGMITKSGLMLGLGEKEEEIIQTLSDLRKVSSDLLTIGQYLQPTKTNASTQKYYSPEQFDRLKRIALGYGFSDVASGPLVRSSFEARKLYETSHKKVEVKSCAI